MKNTKKYVGLDVSKEKIAVAIAVAGRLLFGNKAILFYDLKMLHHT
jgi:hypothetical protein